MGERPAVEIELLEDDAGTVLRAAGAREPTADRLADLLSDGLAHYLRDEAEWDVLSRDGPPGVHGVRLGELKRRETEALTVSMRARTIASEIRMEALRVRVKRLQQQRAALGHQMNTLRSAASELRRHRGRLAALLEPADPGGRESPARTGLVERLGRFLGLRGAHR
jgi:hypothetical protein